MEDNRICPNGAVSLGGKEGASGMCLSAVIFVIRRETALYISETQLFKATKKIPEGLGQKDRLGGAGDEGEQVGPGWWLLRLISSSVTFEAGSKLDRNPAGPLQEVPQSWLGS